MLPSTAPRTHFHVQPAVRRNVRVVNRQAARGLRHRSAGPRRASRRMRPLADCTISAVVAKDADSAVDHLLSRKPPFAREEAVGAASAILGFKRKMRR